MQYLRAIHLATATALLAGAATCYAPAMEPARYIDVYFPPREPQADWGRVDPELRAAGIRLHVDIDGAAGAGDSIGDVHHALDEMATVLDHLPAGAEAPRVAAATQHIRERAALLASGAADHTGRRAVIKDALDSAGFAMLLLAGYKYGLDPGVRERVLRFRQQVNAIDPVDTPDLGIGVGIGVGRLEMYDAFAGGRDALAGFTIAIATGKVRGP